VNVTYFNCSLRGPAGGRLARSGLNGPLTYRWFMTQVRGFRSQ
jgi:hypothetical protein